jgi:flagellar motor switch protein FliG
MASMASAIRKAAILVSSLDIQSADNLLDQMGEQLAAQVRAAVMSLGEVPSEVQQAVVEEFLKAQGRTVAPLVKAPALAQSPVDSDVELVLSAGQATGHRVQGPAAKAKPAPQASSPDGTKVVAPFEFLASTPIVTLATYLQREHIQTIAVVIDQLSPDRAAKVLEHFSPALQSQVVMRMAALEEADVDALSAISAALESSIGPLPAPPVRQGSRIQSLKAVISRIAEEKRSELLDRVGESDYDLAAVLGSSQDVVPSDEPGVSSQHVAAQSQSATNHGPPRPARLVDLSSVSDAVLATVLREAPAHWVLLALAGAEPALLIRLQGMMPAKQWAGLQQRLRGLGPYRLSDIAAANRALAEIAGRLAKPADRKAPRAEKIAA